MDQEPPSEKAAKRNGRPPFEPTEKHRKLVTALAAFMVPQKTICDLLDNAVSVNTLKKHFGHELETGRERVKARLMVGLLAAADRGNIRALTFLVDRMCTAELPRPMQPTHDPQEPVRVIVTGGLRAIQPNGHGAGIEASE